MYEQSNYVNANQGTVSLPQGLTEPKRQPQVAESFAVLERTIEAHQKLAAELESRLSPVLRNEPEATESGNKDSSTVVGVAARINESTERLHRLSNTYNSILRRLEI